MKAKRHNTLLEARLEIFIHVNCCHLAFPMPILQRLVRNPPSYYPHTL